MYYSVEKHSFHLTPDTNKQNNFFLTRQDFGALLILQIMECLYKNSKYIKECAETFYKGNISTGCSV